MSKIIFLCSAFVFSSCSTMEYIFDSGIEQWKLFNRAQPIEDVLKSPNTKAQTKAAIQTVREAKKFSTEDLGLKATNSYRQFVQLDGEYVSWVVVASHPLRLNPKQWRFPIVGDIPYLGFFSKQAAENYAGKLKTEEFVEVGGQKLPWDIIVRGAPAFSSLGWFPDPLYSSMITDDEGDIANLVIHESFHATVWVKSQVELNERLANFIGLQGSLLYLEKKYGKNSSQIQDANAAVAGEQLFASFIDQIIKDYKQTIESIADSNPQLALQKKADFYKSLNAKYSALYQEKLQHNPHIKKFQIDFSKWNNANILNYLDYYADFTPLIKLLAGCNHDLKKLIATLKKINEKDSAQISVLLNGGSATCLD